MKHPQLILKSGMDTRSIGVKLVLICVLALLMTIPSFFVGDLVSERTRRAADVTKEISSHVGGPQTFRGPTLAIPYSILIFASRLQAIRAFVVLGVLYVWIYLLLRLQHNALLVGAISSFLAVTAVMYSTRGLDWYSSSLASSTGEQPIMPEPVRDGI